MKILKIALKNKPNFVCIVPEKRKEVTTEGGLNLKKNIKFLKKLIYKLKKNNIKVSLFIEPKITNIILTKAFGADCVELHTGKFCHLINKKGNANKEFLNIKKTAHYANQIGLDVHAGHGLTFESARKIAKIKNISEFNIGHFLISESLFISLRKSIKKFKKIINR